MSPEQIINLFDYLSNKTGGRQFVKHHHKPIKPIKSVHKPIKPIKYVHKPFKPSTTVHKLSPKFHSLSQNISTALFNEPSFIVPISILYHRILSFKNPINRFNSGNNSLFCACMFIVFLSNRNTLRVRHFLNIVNSHLAVPVSEKVLYNHLIFIIDLLN